MTLRFPVSAVAQAAADFYTAGAGLRAWLYRSGWRRPRRLRAPVLSIGNLAWGGTGKTPLTIWLAERLTAAGLRVSILTRGYRRSSLERLRILPPGSDPRQALRDGDEAQLYLRHLTNVPIGIAASRYEAGRALEEQYAVDVHLLDDGFQHLALARDLDIVLVDAQNPWGSRAGLRRLLRESPRALRRAGAIVLTHCDSADSPRWESLRAELRQLHPAAPLYHAAAQITAFLPHPDGPAVEPRALRGSRALAFCGLGSPDRFFAALAAAGIQCCAQKRFRDHHRYRPEELRALEALAGRAGAEILITTEKDLVNLPPEAAFRRPLYWARLQLRVEEAEEMLAQISAVLHLPLPRNASGETSGQPASPAPIADGLRASPSA